MVGFVEVIGSFAVMVIGNFAAEVIDSSAEEAGGTAAAGDAAAAVAGVPGVAREDGTGSLVVGSRTEAPLAVLDLVES